VTCVVRSETGRRLVEQHRKLVSEHEDGAHLEQDAEGVTDVVGVELLEGLGAVAALEDEGATHGWAHLPGEDNRRERLDRLEHGIQLLLAQVLGAAASKCRLLLRHRDLGAVGAGWGGDRMALWSRRGGLWSRGDTMGDGVETVGVG
jgi:hypothetical protein